jgi:restriction endonuclease S subunit
MDYYSANNAKNMSNCYEFSSTFIKNIPIKSPSPETEEEIVEKVKDIERKLDQDTSAQQELAELDKLIFELYEISEVNKEEVLNNIHLEDSELELRREYCLEQKEK